jgi:hypothetical protein
MEVINGIRLSTFLSSDQVPQVESPPELLCSPVSHQAPRRSICELDWGSMDLVCVGNALTTQGIIDGEFEDLVLSRSAK